MFEGLTDKFNDIFKKLRGIGKLTPSLVDETMRSIRMALLEADVNYKVVKHFIDRVKVKAIGQEILESFTPAQAVIDIVNTELIDILGQNSYTPEYPKKKLSVVYLIGLQGSGKTTTIAKLGKYYQSQGYKVLLAAVDVYRPAAIEQLQILSHNNNLEFFTFDSKKPVKIVREMKKYAEANDFEICLVDTAGRLHIDKELISELKSMKKKVPAYQTFLVLDSMTGQEAINIAGEFNTQVKFDGVILTKMDGDARGGAALSIHYTTQKPVVYIGVGETIDALEQFYPDRLASRILGMGDVLSLIDKVKSTIDEKTAEEMAARVMSEELNFNDYLVQIVEMRKMGSVEQLLEMLPGFGAIKKQLRGQIPTDDDIKKIQAIIQSMTVEERTKPGILNAGRRRRISLGSGTKVSDVNKLIKQFGKSKKILKQFKKIGKKGIQGMNLPF